MNYSRLIRKNDISSLLASFLLIFILINGVFVRDSKAQYFGRNKPGYRTFNFDVAQTPNFDIHHYLDNDSLVKIMSQWSERWYTMHQKIFKDSFDIRNPLILYTTQADFQQTNTIQGLIGAGTGGVTESLKNRVIMPVAFSLAQTDHVLGHELIHAFQYNLFLKTLRMRDASLRNIPLWMIEGMAEYLTKGSIDPHTAMVMRDAFLNNDLPTLKQMSTDTRYFPYTYGQAFWAMASKTWGDSIIIPLLVNTAIYGLDKGIENVFGFNEKAMSAMWKSSTELHFSRYLKNQSDSLAGRKVISDKNGGRINISPSISPDGKYIAFFSEKDVFTLDLFLADAESGKIIKKLSSVVRNNEIDDFNFIESSGTWSPDGKRFAFVVFSKGINKLAILNVSRGRIIDELEIPGVSSFSNPAWSPDGKKIVVTGLVEGISDLYLYSLDNGGVDKLTDEFPSAFHPSWSSDGNSIVFSQESVNDDGGQTKYSFNVAILDLNNRTVNKIDVFNGAYNMNPYFSGDDKQVYFLSNQDGFRNLYRYNLETRKVYRLTEYMTGISGITSYSPAISVSRNDDMIAYNYYFDDKYQIYLANDHQFKAEEADLRQDFAAGTLPPLNGVVVNQSEEILYNTRDIAQLPADSIEEMPYRPRFKLDYISNTGNVGISTGLYRNNLGGSINMIFGDMVGNHQIYSSLALNGEIYDFGGQVAYINQKNKLKWGAALSHIPFRSGSIFLTMDSIDFGDEKILVENLVVDYLRIFEDNISLFAYYPLSMTRRFEATASSSWYYYRLDRLNNYYLPNGPGIGGTREKLPAPDGMDYQQISLAYVEDNSYFGMTAPMQGHRGRFQVERYFGDANLFTTLVDYRKYFFINPLSLAVRLYNYGLYGDSDGETMPQLYLGNPWLIRGYENAMNTAPENNFNISGLSGSRIAVANAEIRLPLSGPERLALIKSKWVFADLNLFFDSGIAWSSENNIRLNSDMSARVNSVNRSPVFSTGASLRVNLFGYLVVEPYYAFPLSNGGFKNGTFGLNFIPGW